MFHRGFYPFAEYFSPRRSQGKVFPVRASFLWLALVGDQSGLLHSGKQGIGLAAAQGPDDAHIFLQILVQVIPVLVPKG